MMGCSIAGCDRRFYARGLCHMHYKRMWRTGTTRPADPPRPLVPIESRFWVKVEKSDGCWLWLGTASRGYGKFRVNGRMVQAHRFAYELASGPVPDGLHVDHLCRTTLCVRPDHLEAVTNQVNVLRGVGPSAENARKERCKHGHEFTPENTGTTSRGGRFCRECARIRLREYRLRRKATA